MFFKSKLEVTPESILRVLAQIIDPDLKRDIVSLGFVKDIRINKSAVSFKIELTTPACPVKDEIKQKAESLVREIPGVEKVEVEMTANVRPAVSGGAGKISLPNIKNLIAVASGKGGVGKSTVALNLAMSLSLAGAKVGLLDADIYGPSVPMMTGTKEKPLTENGKIIPIEKEGLKLMSMGYLVPENEAVIWRGPMVHGALTQFLTQVNWGELDYLIIDMPPGTGDAQLTMSQTAPLAGAIIVTTPQEISLLDARRGMKMFMNVHVPVLGIVENMSGFVCGHCQEVTTVFKTGGGEKLAKEGDIPFLGAIPLDPKIVEAGDLGYPIVLSHPESLASKIYAKMAGEVAAELSMVNAKASGNFQSLNLEWRT